MSSPSGKKTITNLPPGYVQAAQKALLQQVQQWYAQGGTQHAGFDPAQLRSLLEATQYANSSGLAKQISGAQGAESFLTNKDLLNPNSNPYLKKSVEAALAPIQSNYSRVVMPSLNSGAAAAGAYGGSRQGVAQAIAAQDLSRQVAGTSASMYSNAYQHGLNTMLQGLRLAPGIARLGLIPSQILGNVGSARQKEQQAQNNQPYNNLAGFSNLIGSGKGTVTSADGASTSPWAGALGGAATGAAMGSEGGLGWGSLIGAGIGAIGGYASGGGFG